MKLLLPLLLLATGLTVRAETLYFFAAQDTWFDEMPVPLEGEESAGLAAGGAAQLIVGRVGFNDSTPRRRTLIQFDLTGLPENALVLSASVSLYAFKVKTDFATLVTLQRLSSEWTAGEYNPGSSGHSSGSDPGDATWLHTSSPGQWTTPGGDFLGVTSAATLVGSTGLYTWSSPELTADVQSWLGGAAENHGWIVRGDETTEFSTVKEFASMEHPESDFAPVLTLDFVIVPEPAVSMLGLVAGLCLGGRRSARAVAGRR